MRILPTFLAFPALATGCVAASENTIPWAEVRPLLETCQVVTVFQTHDRWVTLTLKDDREVHARSPYLDDIVRLAGEVDGCDGEILVIME